MYLQYIEVLAKFVIAARKKTREEDRYCIGCHCVCACMCVSVCYTR